MMRLYLTRAVGSASTLPAHLAQASRFAVRAGPRALSAAVLLAGLGAAAAQPFPSSQCSAAAHSDGGSSRSRILPSSDDVSSWRVLGITGDGRCLFRALAQGKHLAQQADASAAGGLPIRHELLAPETERQQADALRAATCDELLARRAEVEPFIEGDFETYVDGMRAPSVWGGEPELAMATHVIRRPIAVLSPTLQLISSYGDEYAGSPVPLLFHSVGHYDLLMRALPTPAAKL